MGRTPRWWVVTPTFEYHDLISQEIGGPIYEERDVIEVEAETAREAVRVGVRLMLGSRYYQYCRDQRAEGLCPYTGVKAEPVEAERA